MKINTYNTEIEIVYNDRYEGESYSGATEGQKIKGKLKSIDIQFDDAVLLCEKSKNLIPVILRNLKKL